MYAGPCDTVNTIHVMCSRLSESRYKCLNFDSHIKRSEYILFS